MTTESLKGELLQEAVSTENLLKVIPSDKLNWKPQERAMTLGQLALHVATIPGRNLGFARDGQVRDAVIVAHPSTSDKDFVLRSFTESISTAVRILDEADNELLARPWKLNGAEKTIAEMPTSAYIRAFVLNHWYHHRGELATYLRTLDQKLPSIYGPTADVNPFQ